LGADQQVPRVCSAATEGRTEASLIEYADAHHAFDAPVLPAEVKVPDGNSVTNCSLEQGDEHRLEAAPHAARPVRA
jgi:hypothetical protein